MALEAQFRTPEAPVGADRLERHRVDRPGPPQLFAVLDRPVAGILGGGRGPQQALRARAAGGEPLPLLPRGKLLVDLVGAAGARDRRLAAQRTRSRLAAGAQGIELFVDRGVDAAAEEARDRGHLRHALPGGAALS